VSIRLTESEKIFDRRCYYARLCKDVANQYEGMGVLKHVCIGAPERREQRDRVTKALGLMCT
jgi:hypothetical protein